MKGKYANTAAARQARETAETRATTAEAKAARLENDLTELRQNTDQIIARLKTQLAETALQRDQASGPAVTALEEQNRQLRADRDQQRATADLAREQLLYAGRRMIIALQAVFGIKETEAIELVANTIGASVDKEALIVQGHELTAGIKDPTLVKILQRAKGVRASNDLLARATEALGHDDDQAKVRQRVTKGGRKDPRP